MLIFTDAGYKKGVSSHGFVAKHWNGAVIKVESFVGMETDSIRSEIASIVSALNWVNGLKKYPKRQVRIYTDCLPIYEAVYGINKHSIDVTYIKHQLKQTNAKLLWRKRNAVEVAHILANKQMKYKNKHTTINGSKVKYNCEGIAKFKSKKKGTYKNKIS